MNCIKCGKKVGGLSNYGDSGNPRCFDCANSVLCAGCNNIIPVGEAFVSNNKKICRMCHDKIVAEAAILQKADLYADPYDSENIDLDYAAKNFTIRWRIHPVIIGLLLVIKGLAGIAEFILLVITGYFGLLSIHQLETQMIVVKFVFAILATIYGLFSCLQSADLIVIQDDSFIYKNKRYYMKDIVSAERITKKIMIRFNSDVITIPCSKLKTKDIQNFIVHLKRYDKQFVFAKNK